MARPGLLGLLIVFAMTNFATGVVSVLFAPMVLSFASSVVLGSLMSAGGFGMLVGSLIMSAWGGPKRRIYGVVGFEALMAVCVMVAGLPISIPTMGAAVFLFFFCGPFVNGSSQAIWQGKTAADVQGRVFAVRRMIAWSSLPLSYLIAGPLADHVFEPLLAAGGPLAESVGKVTGDRAAVRRYGRATAGGRGDRVEHPAPAAGGGRAAGRHWGGGNGNDGVVGTFA